MKKQTNLTEANKDNEVSPFVTFVTFCKTYSFLRIVRLFAAILFFALADSAQAQFTWTTNADNTITITGYTRSGGDVTIPAAITGLPVTGIGYGAFATCFSLTNVTIPNGVALIGDDAFEQCSSLTSVTIPGSVTSIGADAFVYCGLRSVLIGVGVNSIGDQAFFQCSLTNVSIPETVTSIGFSAFEYNFGLTSVTIPTGVTSIGDGAFTYTGLTNVTIPATVTNIGGAPFVSCPLIAIEVDAQNSFYRSVNGVLFNRDQTTLVEYPASKPIASYAIPDSVTDIGPGAFSDSELATITISKNVTSIPGGAFQDSQFLTRITIPNGVTNIGGGAFSSCFSLTNVTMANGVTSIGDRAFAFCASLTNITMPGSVTSIGYEAFIECDHLTGVVFLGQSPPTLGQDAFSKYPRYINPVIGYVNVFIVTIYSLPDRDDNAWSVFHADTGLNVGVWDPFIETGDGSFGVQNGLFGFNITCPSDNIPIAVEACTDLANPVWTPLATMTLTNGSVYFSEPLQTNTPARFYRIGSP